MELSPHEFREIRTGLGLTLRDLAPLLGYTGTGAADQVRWMENGKKPIRSAQARLMVAYRDGYRPDDWPGS